MVSTHYPGFNVLAEQLEWDETSRHTVVKRLQPAAPKFLRPDELECVRAVAANLLYESRPEVLDFVVSHVDKQLGSPLGEAQRKAELPPQDVLVRQGLAALNGAAESLEQKMFAHCTPQTQAHILQTLQKGKAPLPAQFADVNEKRKQKALFNKLLLLCVEAFASHPTVWSEMGYPGPAYPRGYYRIERRRHDPWEAVAIPLPGLDGEVNGRGDGPRDGHGNGFGKGFRDDVSNGAKGEQNDDPN